MADGRGGRRTPERPAPASGPGRLSRRTDGGPAQKMRDLPNAAYGEQAAMQETQAGAPMALTAPPTSAQFDPSAAATPPVEVIPFGAPTARPNEPITSGVDIGEGPGSDTLGLPDRAAYDQMDAERLRNALPVWEFYANTPGAPPSMRLMVRRLKGILTGT